MAHTGVKITELPAMANMLANSAMPIVDLVLDETQQTNVKQLGTFILNNVAPTVTSNLGTISNVTILGGAAGFKLTTNGNGSLYWSADANTAPGGANTTVQYNNNGTFAGSNAFVYNSTSNTLTIITANVNTLNSNVVTVATNANLGQVGNVKILGGANGQILSTDGAGNLTWKNDTSFPTMGNGGNASTSMLMLASMEGGNAFSVYT